MRKASAILGICFGAALVAHATWIPMKAWLAQQLLRSAWQATLEGERARPWPWADMYPIALLEIDGEELIVLDGASGRALAFGPGLLASSARPGESGVCVIAGHRDTSFTRLGDLARGARLNLTTRSGETITYEVTRIETTPSSEWTTATSDQKLVLVTCVASDHERRLVVEATRV